MSVILWFLQNYSFQLTLVTDASKSILGALGGLLAPLFKPQGFGTWQAAVALLTGLVAKEAVVSSLAMFYGFSLSAQDTAIAAALSNTFTPGPLTPSWCSCCSIPLAWPPFPPCGGS